MGIFGALTTSVTGMRAQSFALENISGNIANSQTTAFKRVDTSFIDLVPDQPPSKQLAGNVSAQARSTNTVQGDIQSASIGTFMAINGDGFFVVQKPSSTVDNRPVFSGIDLFTRRGDFQPDKNGYLVNGAGYFLMGIPVDASTGNLVGSVPQVLKFQNDLLPAQQTTEIEYRANLASLPLTANYDDDIPGSELLNPANFIANPVAGPPSAAKITGIGATLSPDAPAKVTGTAVLPPTITNAGSLTINGSAAINITAGMTPAQVVAAINAAAPAGIVLPPTLDATGHLVITSTDADTDINVASASTAMMAELGLSVGITKPTNLLTQSAVAQGDTLIVTIGAATKTITFGTGAGEVSTLAELNSAPDGLGGVGGGIASVNTATGNITITASSSTETITITGTAIPKTFGMQTKSAIPSNQVVIGSDESAFLEASIGGGAVTAYDLSGSPVNIQLRWAKIDSVASGGVDKWNLFYQVKSGATGTQVAWQNVGTDYIFGSNFQLNPPITNLTLEDVTVNGLSLGDVQLVHGAGGITQFADPNGNAQVNLLQQNGFAAGELQSVSVNDKGRMVGSYSNGRTIDLAEITLASFNGPNNLKRIDGGAFETTDESGPAIYGAAGKIVGSSLEGSNTDIADEFTKLIVTQQAYSANTRVISTTNQMVQDLLNMLR
ncbi:MAG TPA: flagellar hook-basal body complex protein [Xanthobacteraceae bacterium]|nr:flagellar hook-basal body complex protein [Xanthobacteraceae bacterium]